VDEASDAVIRVATRVPPHTANAAVMSKTYATFRRLYPALHSIESSFRHF
jgi:hypothetical protein